MRLLAVLVIALLTWTNTRGLKWGKLIQNVFTSAKTVALAGLVASLQAQGKSEEAQAQRREAGKAWPVADAALMGPLRVAP